VASALSQARKFVQQSLQFNIQLSLTISIFALSRILFSFKRIKFVRHTDFSGLLTNCFMNILHIHFQALCIDTEHEIETTDPV